MHFWPTVDSRLANQTGLAPIGRPGRTWPGRNSNHESTRLPTLPTTALSAPSHTHLHLENLKKMKDLHSDSGQSRLSSNQPALERDASVKDRSAGCLSRNTVEEDGQGIQQKKEEKHRVQSHCSREGVE